MDEYIAFMLNRFPTHRSKIIDQYTNNEDFKTLCQDLHSSARMLELRQKLLLSHSTSELEYRKLYLDLENEVVRFLDAAAGHP
jgi:hypothetical protein